MVKVRINGGGGKFVLRGLSQEEGVAVTLFFVFFVETVKIF